ncbi:hypothetical protein B7486_53710, partial [cyanobacterium TDX16]
MGMSHGRTARRTSSRGGRPQQLLLVVLLTTALLAAACSDGDSSAPTDDSTSTGSETDDAAASTLGDLPYADSGWVTLHGDPGNRKYQPDAAAADEYTSWQALADTSVLAAPSTGTDGQYFVGTGLPEGESNLHAFSPDGELLWQSEPWSGTTGVDPCALLSTPIVDDAGDLYLSDCDQVWAFHPDGEVKWTADLPDAPADSAFAD